MGEDVDRKIDQLRHEILESLGSEISLLSAISEGMRLGLASRNWRYVELTRQTTEEAVGRLARIRDEAS